ncbi:MAG: hypothetical protein M5U34_41535 [Chloroflexi bacterium]|nr:hypothetical protein [Chloroflexota bacterium]
MAVPTHPLEFPRRLDANLQNNGETGRQQATDGLLVAVDAGERL